MKKVELICVGKLKEQFYKDGVEEYVKRLSRFCKLTITELMDFPSGEDAKEKESCLILKRLINTGVAFKVLLDINGDTLSSVELSNAIDKAYTSGHEKVVFIIGGSLGVSSEVNSVCDLVLSFGRVTFPHQLMRLMVCEQIYRSFTIKAGMPYHK